VTARVRNYVRSLFHQRQDLHSIDLPLPLGRSGMNLSSSGVRFQVAREVLSCSFSLVYCLSYRDPLKSSEICTFRCPITFRAFANLIFRLVLLSSCPS
jgi:hypothetical protein